jgi:hypothetical protein
MSMLWNESIVTTRRNEGFDLRALGKKIPWDLSHECGRGVSGHVSSDEIWYG